MFARYVTRAVAFLAVALFLAAPAFAAIEISGKVVSVEKETLTMFDGSSTQTLIVNKETKIMIKGKEGQLSDLKVDDEVMATVEPDGEKLIAKTITVE